MKKKIIIFGPHSFSFLNFRYDLIQLLKKKYDLTLCGKLLNNDKEKIKKLNVNFFNINHNNSKIQIINDILNFFKIFTYFIKNKPDIVISYTIKSNLFAGILSFFFYKKIFFFFFFTGLGNIFLNSKKKIFKLKLFIFFYKTILKNFDKVFFQNKDDLKFFKSNKIIKDNFSLNYITGVNINKFKKKKLPKKIAFLMISRIIKNKGIHEYLLAANYLKKKYRDINFYFAGNYEKSDYSIEKKTFETLSNKSIINLGWQSDIKKAIKKSSILVLPSYREGLPRSVLEAMSMGRAIIVTNVAGCKETVKNNYNGYLVKVQNYKDLQKKMEKLILNKSIIKIFGNNSRKIVIQKFNSKKLAIKINKIIKKCVE